MPILKEEPSLFPETLLENCNEDPSDRRWWVIYTKARQEKALSRELFSSRIPFYLPLIKNTRISRGRRRTSFVPLFSGYIFLYATEAERIRSMTTNRVSRILTVSDPMQLVFDLEQLRRLIASDAPLSLERRLAPGDRVRVKQGALMGLEGTVLVRRGVTRLLVRVNFLQQGASVEVHDYLLERLD
ncbi:MAG TPA: transcription termination/antitermination NusG family protein [Thermoguttaceae bacterium]